MRDARMLHPAPVRKRLASVRRHASVRRGNPVGEPMISFRALALCVALLGVGAARAQSTTGAAATVAVACCHVAADTPVELEIIDMVSSRDRKHGDRFGLRLHAPLLADGG